MSQKNKLDEVPLADVSNEELLDITSLEKKLHDKYYLIAFKKSN